MVKCQAKDVYTGILYNHLFLKLSIIFWDAPNSHLTYSMFNPFLKTSLQLFPLYINNKHTINILFVIEGVELLNNKL
jgi:hypothetical protein